jgi:FtsH-binding integral membrane protein
VAERPQPGLREVLLVAGAAVVVVLGAAVLTGLLPAEAQRVFFHLPITIIVLVVGTAYVLWRIASHRTPEA